MYKCQHCNSGRVAVISAKVSDMCQSMMVNSPEYEPEDFERVPDDMNIHVEIDSDMLEFQLCLDCGTVQGQWPLPETKLERRVQDQEDENEDDGNF